jgi:hypothetical protein
MSGSLSWSKLRRVCHWRSSPMVSHAESARSAGVVAVLFAKPLHIQKTEQLVSPRCPLTAEALDSTIRRWGARTYR